MTPFTHDRAKLDKVSGTLVLMAAVHAIVVVVAQVTKAFMQGKFKISLLH